MIKPKPMPQLGHAWTAWRVLIVFSSLVACAALVAGPLLYLKATNAVAQNRRTLCSIGSFLVKAPIGSQQAELTRKQLLSTLKLSQRFLHQLKDAHCTDLKGLPEQVTPKAIERQLQAIKDEIKRQEAGHGEQPVPPSEPQVSDGQQGGGSVGTASAPSTPAGGGSTGTSSPPTSTSPSSPPTTGPPGTPGSPGSPGTPGTPGSPGSPTPPQEEPGPVEQVGGTVDDAIDHVTTTVCNLAPALCQ